MLILAIGLTIALIFTLYILARACIVTGFAWMLWEMIGVRIC